MNVRQKPLTLQQFIRSAVLVGMTANAAYDAARTAGYRVRRQTFYQLFRERQRVEFDL